MVRSPSATVIQIRPQEFVTMPPAAKTWTVERQRKLPVDICRLSSFARNRFQVPEHAAYNHITRAVTMRICRQKVAG